MVVCPQGKGAGHEGAALHAIDAVMKIGIENASETQVNKFLERGAISRSKGPRPQTMRTRA